jgi:hypothetical protein
MFCFSVMTFTFRSTGTAREPTEDLLGLYP